MLVKLTKGVNFTYILRENLLPILPKNYNARLKREKLRKTYSYKKAASKMLMKLTLGIRSWRIPTIFIETLV